MCKICGFEEVHSALIEAWGKGEFQHKCSCFSLVRSLIFSPLDRWDLNFKDSCMVTLCMAAAQRRGVSLWGFWCCTSSCWPQGVARMWGGGRGWPLITPHSSWSCGLGEHWEIPVMLHVLLTAACAVVCGCLNWEGLS